MSNTPQNIIAEGETPEALSRAEQIKESAISAIGEATRTKFVALVGMLGLAGSVATAQEATNDRAELIAALNADRDRVNTIIDDDASYQVAGLPLSLKPKELSNESAPKITETPEEAMWFNDLDLGNERLSRLVVLSLEGNNPYSERALQELATYTPEQQAAIVELVYEMGEGDLGAQDTFEPEEKEIALVRELRVPSASIEDMMTEASEKGVSERRQRKLVEVISDLQAFGQITKGQLRALERYVPDTSKFVPAVRLTQESLRALAESEARLAQVEEDLETATAARIVSEARLAESEEALAAAREAEESGRRALELLGNTFGNNG